MKVFTNDSETIKAIRHTAGQRGRTGNYRYSVEWISNYYGVMPAQIEQIRRNLPTGETRGRKVGYKVQPKLFCTQCDKLVSNADAERCESSYCKAKAA